MTEGVSTDMYIGISAGVSIFADLRRSLGTIVNKDSALEYLDTSNNEIKYVKTTNYDE